MDIAVDEGSFVLSPNAEFTSLPETDTEAESLRSAQLLHGIRSIQMASKPVIT